MAKRLGTCIDCQGLAISTQTNICKFCHNRRAKRVIPNQSFYTYRKFMQQAPGMPFQRTYIVP